MKLFILIPCLNEERTIASVIGKIPRQLEGIDKIEVVVIDDGSTDQTAFLATEAGAEVISHGRNLGVGAAFSTGINYALKNKADLVVNIDADGQFDPNLISELVAPIVKNEADFVSCSRFMERSLVPAMPKLKIWGNQQMASLVSFLTKQKFYDVSCGFRAYSREALLNLNLFGKFTYTQESFLDMAFKGMRMKEVPMPVRGEREFGKSRVANNLFSYGTKSLTIIIRTIRDYRPLEFFGLTGAFFVLSAIFLFGFLGAHWLRTGSFTPFKSVGFIGAFLASVGLIVIVLALIADMLDRIRLNQERLLYYEKEKRYDIEK